MVTTLEALDDRLLAQKHDLTFSVPPRLHFLP